MMGAMVSKRSRWTALLGGAIVALLGLGTVVDMPDLAARDNDTLPACGELPPEASATADAIREGGPFPYPDRDGSRFGNYENRLPEQPSGFYREYTVDTPGVDHRGARRIVTGGDTPTDPESWYYTDDHYESFCEMPQ